MSEHVPAIKVLLLPKDTNALGTIFGGVILSHIDLASAVEARRVAPYRYVTKAMREVEFHAPVFVGDLVNFFTETVRVGHTSVTVKVLVEVERWSGGHGEHVTDTARHSRILEVPRCVQRQLRPLVTLTRPRPRKSRPPRGLGRVSVTEAEVVLVAVGPDGRPTAVRPGAGPA